MSERFAQNQSYHSDFALTKMCDNGNFETVTTLHETLIKKYNPEIDHRCYTVMQ